MDGKLVLSTMILGFVDANSSNNPQLKGINWNRSATVSCSNPKTQPYRVSPGDTVTLFNGTRSTTMASDTELNLSLTSISDTGYRLAWTGVGTAPGFRTNRNITGDGVAITMTVNANLSVTMGAGSAIFSSVQVGDTVFLPGPTTGDSATPFATLNEGEWTVIAKFSSSSIQLARLLGVDFSGTSETVTLTDDAQLQAYSVLGVQVGDKVNISAGFSTSSRKIFTVTAVTASRVDFESFVPLPTNNTAVPGTSGITFYTQSKSWFRLEVTQDAIVRLNGDTSDSNRLSPWSAGDINFTGAFEKAGQTWRMDVQNISAQPMDLVLISID